MTISVQSIKKCLFFILAMCSTTFVNAQYGKTPAIVIDSFAAKYANATAIVWKDNNYSFQAAFKIGDSEMKSTFSSKGKWLGAETKMIYNNLPAEVKEGFMKSKYAAIPIRDIAKLEERGKPLQDRIIVMKGTLNKTSLVFSNTGQLMSEKNFL